MDVHFLVVLIDQLGELLVFRLLFKEWRWNNCNILFDVLKIVLPFLNFVKIFFVRHHDAVLLVNIHNLFKKMNNR